MKVHLDIFKVQKEFAIEHGTRYVVRVHNFGTPNYRWFGAESLIEIYDHTRELSLFDWNDIEEKIDECGGFHAELDMDDFRFARLFVI
jgi:hypothetical protein